MKIGIVGYGKMGQMVERLATSDGHEIGAIIRRGDEFAALKGCDVAIEFTQPSAAVSNLKQIGLIGIPAVSGTTGWFSDVDTVKDALPALVYGSNFSIGVAVFSIIVSKAAGLMATLPQYEAFAWEAHHSQKKDAPSGTLVTLVQVMQNSGYEAHVDISSTRAGKIPGTHEIGFDSAEDSITLRHTARNREGFARGAIFAAGWLIGKSGCHEFSEVVRDQLRDS